MPDSTPAKGCYGYTIRLRVGVEGPDKGREDVAEYLARRVKDAPGDTFHVVSVETADDDWTVDPETGRSNTSTAYLALVHEVDRLIRSEGSAIVHGNSRQVAALIVSQLAHRHGLAPSGESIHA